MPVTAKFIPESIQLVPGAPTTVTLRLHNNEEAPQVVHLLPSGDLAEFVTLDVDTAAIESNQIFDIPVSVEVGPHVAAGERQPTVEFTSECWQRHCHGRRRDHRPQRALRRAVTAAVAGSSSGRHTVRVVNSGNVAVTVDLSPDTLDEEITLDVEPTFVVTPGSHRPGDLAGDTRDDLLERPGPGTPVRRRFHQLRRIDG